MILHTILLDISQLNTSSEQLLFENRMLSEQSGLQIESRSSYIADNKNAFLITDHRRAADWAVAHGIGYAVYLNENSHTESFPEALYCIDDLSALSALQVERMYKRFHNIPWNILETDRCILREMTETDIDTLYEIYADKEISRYTENLFPNREQELAYTRDYIKNQYWFYEYGIWVIIRKCDRKLIGRAGITNRDGFENAELGYVIAADCQNQGYASEVCRAILDYSKNELQLKQLNAFTRCENIFSIKLLNKLGFQKQDEIILQENKHNWYVWNS